MEPYRRPPKVEQAHDEEEVNSDEHRPRHESQRQDQNSGPGYYSSTEYRHYQYYHHHYYPPHPPASYPYDHYYYSQYHYGAPPAPSPDGRWYPRPSRPTAVPVTDEGKHQDGDDRKRPANIHVRNDSDGSRKLDPYEPIPWNEAQAQPMLVTSEAQAQPMHFASDTQSHAYTEPHAASKKSSPPTLKSPPEEASYPYDRRDSGSFSPIEVSSAHLTGSQYEKADTIWDIRFKELTAFKLQHGHCNVPQKYPPNKSLGIWVNKQRMEYNKRLDGKKKSSLCDSRLERLKSIGFRWAKRKGQASWENHYAALVAFKEENGHCSVPTKFKEDTALGRWVSTQRAEYKKYNEGEPSTMTDDKIKRLEKVGFAWWMGV